MKTTEVEFEVDYIGEQTSLTIAEEKSLSDYFKQKKASSKVAEMRKPIRNTKPKTIAK